MKRLALLFLAAAGACSGGYAASDPRTGTQTVVLEDGRVPPGARLWLRLEAAVDDESPAGEPFRARLAGPVFTPDGDMLVPRGAVVEGHIVRDGDGAWLAVHSLDAGGFRQALVGRVVGATPPARAGSERPGRVTAEGGLVDDLPAGTRLELRLCAPILPLPDDDA